jgi:DNA polymerase III epsilon subunit-like protein
MTEINKKIVFVDIETTGLPPEIIVPGKRPGTTRKERVPYETGYMDYPYVVSLAYKVNKEESRYFVLNQEGRTIPEEAIKIHGITNEVATESEHTFVSVVLELIRVTQDADIVVGHGLYFDTSVLKANVLREIDKGRIIPTVFADITAALYKDKRIDTMRITNKMFGKWPTLQELHRKLFDKGFFAHNAEEDVEATAACFYWLVENGAVDIGGIKPC